MEQPELGMVGRRVRDGKWCVTRWEMLMEGSNFRNMRYPQPPTRDKMRAGQGQGNETAI